MGNSILITGGTGLIGAKLADRLSGAGYQVRFLSRTPKKVGRFKAFYWDVERGEIDSSALVGVTDIIHLAGAGVADKRWTKSRKAIILSSRVDSSNLLFNAVSESGIELDSFVSASGIGYYGETGQSIVNEESPAGSDFLAEVVKKWEESVDPFSAITRVVKVRIGVVLSTRGGALEKLVTPVKWGVGGPLGRGGQYVSWIHEEDLVSIFQFVLEKDVSGVFNGVAPYPVPNRELTRLIAKTLHRPLFMPPVPGFALRLILGEMASMVLIGTNASSEKLVSKGFEFEYPKVGYALEHLLV